MNWTVRDIGRLRRLVAAGWTDGQIGEEMQRDRQMVRRKRVALQLEPGQSAIMTVMVRKIRAQRRARMRV